MQTIGLPPLILSVETATRAGGVALTRGANVLASVTGDARASQSSTLLRHIETVLKKSSLSLRDVELFAAATGPGSFTGLRIGLATVKALAATLSRLCIGVPTLHAVAHGADPSEHTVALLQAGRGELFAQSFAVSLDCEVRALDIPTHLPPQKLFERFKQIPALKWAGEGARLHAAEIKNIALSSGLSFFDEAEKGRSISPKDTNLWILSVPISNLAENVALLAWQRFQINGACRPDELRAIYVRPSDAELNAR